MRYILLIMATVLVACLASAYAQDGWELRIIGGTLTPGQAQAVANYGHYALVADMEAGLSVFDISNPGFPVSAGSYYHGGIINDLVVNGNYAYLAHWGRGAVVLDISDPTQPDSVGAFNTPGTTIDVFLSGNLLYAADFTNGLVILNVSEINNISQAGRINVIGVIAVAAIDTTVYISAQGVGLLTYSLADTLNPVIRDNDALSTDCNDIVIYGSYLLLANGQSGMAVFDISDPPHPERVATLNTPGSLNRIAVKDTIAYLADGLNGLIAVNITDPRNPRVIQTLDTPGLASGVGFYDDFVLVADRGMFIIVYHDDFVSVVDDTEILPSQFQITNCYPNPFNPSTTVTFELKRSGHINLTVYDIMGRLIAKPVDGFYDIGSYSIDWNASSLPSGVYFFRLSSSDYNVSTVVRAVYLK